MVGRRGLFLFWGVFLHLFFRCQLAVSFVEGNIEKKTSYQQLCKSGIFGGLKTQQDACHVAKNHLHVAPWIGFLRQKSDSAETPHHHGGSLRRKKGGGGPFC